VRRKKGKAVELEKNIKVVKEKSSTFILVIKIVL